MEISFIFPSIDRNALENTNGMWYLSSLFHAYFGVIPISLPKSLCLFLSVSKCIDSACKICKQMYFHALLQVALHESFMRYFVLLFYRYLTFMIKGIYTTVKTYFIFFTQSKETYPTWNVIKKEKRFSSTIKNFFLQLNLQSIHFMMMVYHKRNHFHRCFFLCLYIKV